MTDIERIAKQFEAECESALEDFKNAAIQLGALGVSASEMRQMLQESVGPDTATRALQLTTNN